MADKPNFIDRVVAAVSPRRALARAASRGALRYIYPRGGGYEAGKSGKAWAQRYHPGLTSALTALHGDQEQLRNRSRDQVRNSPLAAGAASIMARSVVGRGLRVRPNPDAETLGMTPEQADEWAMEARRVFERWSMRDGGADVGRNMTFAEMQALVFAGVFEAGDVLVVERYLPMRGAPYGTCFQLIESEQVCNPSDEMDTQEMASGVRVNTDTGEVMGYYVQFRHPGETYDIDDWYYVPAWDMDGMQRKAWLVFKRRRIDERRGAPWLAPIIESLRQLEQYSEAELQAAVIAAMFTVFLSSEYPDDNPLGFGSQLVGADPDDEDSPQARELKERRQIALAPGSIVKLADHQRVSIADPNRPNAEFTPFVETIWQHIGIALGIPYEVLTMRYQSSYSAAKGALAEAWKTFRGHRLWMQEHFCQPAYESVLMEAAAMGEIAVPAAFFTDDSVKKAYCRATWMGDAPAQIDPAKEVEAALLRISGGLSTREREIREMFGDVVFDEIYPQLLKEGQLMAEIEQSVLPRGVSSATVVEPEAEEGDEEDSGGESDDMEE